MSASGAGTTTPSRRLWDYGFIETSTDGGTTWKQEEVFDEAGNMVSTDDGSQRQPGRRLRRAGERSDRGQRRLSARLCGPHSVCGQHHSAETALPDRWGLRGRGWFADDFSVTDDGTEVFSDDVEGGVNGWTAGSARWPVTTGAGWVQTSGAFDYEQYYIAEWRNFDGYDKGLKTPYTTVYQVGDEWRVKRTPYNAPGLLIWQRDASNSFNDISNNLFDPPSIGSKGTVLLVDAHYEPARLSGKAAEANPSGLDNLTSRQQANDVAFGKVGRYRVHLLLPRRQQRPLRHVLQQVRQTGAGDVLHRRQDLVSRHRVPA